MKKHQSRLAHSSLTPFAVVDVETTGLYNVDRIVEISIITLDFETLETLEEYDTLVNPERDISAETTNIHGLTASILEAAPTFKEIAPAIARRLNGAYIVAHNQIFDVRKLSSEFERINASFDGGKPFCTLNLSGGLKLETACLKFGVELEQAHRALTDARASAGLLRIFLDQKEAMSDVPDTYAVARCAVETGEVVIRTLRRENTELDADIKRIGKSPWQDPERDYRYAVNLALDDGEVSYSEKTELEILRKALGLTADEAVKQHQILFDRTAEAATRDGHVSDLEKAMLAQLALSLDIEYEPPEDVTESIELRPGMTVCFTGSGQGMRDKKTMTTIAEDRGFVAKPNFSRKLDVLVAADVSSFSGKAKLAREYGVPIISATEFLRRIESLT